jgi:hypothetical protein
MNPKTIKEELKKLIESYKLPNLEALDREIEIVDLLSERREMPQDMISTIRRRFTEAIYSWINFVHSLIIPNPQSIISNKDAEAFSDKEKEDIYKIMAVLAGMTRESTSFEAKKGKAKEEAKFISDNFPKYLEIKKDLAKLNEKIAAYWQKEAESKQP